MKPRFVTYLQHAADVPGCSSKHMDLSHSEVTLLFLYVDDCALPGSLLPLDTESRGIFSLPKYRTTMTLNSLLDRVIPYFEDVLDR